MLQLIKKTPTPMHRFNLKDKSFHFIPKLSAGQCHTFLQTWQMQ